MKKKILSTLLALCLAFGSTAALPESFVAENTSISVSAETTTILKYGNFRYTILSNGTISIYSYHNSTKSPVNVSIPASIGGKKVTEISSVAFYGERIAAVTIPEGVTKIGSSAFSSSTATSITVPSTVTSIYYNAFNGCDKLTKVVVSSANKNYSSVNGALLNKAGTSLLYVPSGVVNYTVPNGVKTIESDAIYHNHVLQVLTMPASVTTVKAYAFDYSPALRIINIGAGVTSLSGFNNNSASTRFFVGCDKIAEINVDASNKTYSSLGGVLFNKNKTLLMRCPYMRRTVTIPAATTTIGFKAFADCNQLTSVYIPNNVKKIDEYAFYNCLNLKSVILPYGLSEVDYGVFYGCKSLSGICVPSGAKKIYSSFWKCSNLKSAIIPNTVERIYSSAFAECKALTDLYIPSSVTSIAKDILSSGSKPYIYGQKNTAAEQFAKDNSLTFREISQPLTRFAGVNRYDTAKAISAEGVKSTTQTVVLAYGQNYADALAGVPLATLKGAPILLTDKATLPAETLGEIKRLKATKVIILGGEGAISKSIETVLKNNGVKTIQRFSGSSRFGTAVKIAKQVNSAPKEIFFVYGYNYADALSVSTVAAIRKAPIIYLNKSGSIDSETLSYLKSVKSTVTKAYVIGGSGVISDDMMKQAGNALGLKMNNTIERIKGSNKYATCCNVNTKFKSVLTGKSLCIAKGLNFPDALAGGVFAAKSKAPLFLADETLSTEQRTYLKSKNANRLYVFGGTGAVPNAVVFNISARSK